MMNPYLLASLIYFLLGLGLIAFVIALLPFPATKRFISSYWAKVFIGLCRLLSAFTGLFLVPLQPSDPFLAWSILSVSIAFCAWEATSAKADKQAKITQAQLATLEKSIHQIRFLLTMLRELIASKRTAIGSHLTTNRSGRMDTLSRVRATLDPPLRIRELMASLARLLIIESQSGGRATIQSFRVCLYVEMDGFMREKSSWD